MSHCCKIDWTWENHKMREWNCIYFCDTKTDKTLSRISLILLKMFLYSNAWWTFTLPRQLVHRSFRLNTKVKLKTFHFITTLLHYTIAPISFNLSQKPSIASRHPYIHKLHTNYTLSLGPNHCLSQTHHICHHPSPPFGRYKSSWAATIPFSTNDYKRVVFRLEIWVFYWYTK